MSEGKRLCELNNCSDAFGRRYPECDIRRGLEPAVCPHRASCSKVLKAVNAHDQFVTALKEIRNSETRGILCHSVNIASDALEAAGEEV